jgi:hypothetical protein
VAAIAADVIKAIQAFVAPVPVNVTSTQIGVPTSPLGAGRRRFLQSANRMYHVPYCTQFNIMFNCIHQALLWGHSMASGIASIG